MQQSRQRNGGKGIAFLSHSSAYLTLLRYLVGGGQTKKIMSEEKSDSVLPAFDEDDLPVGIHPCSLEEILERLGSGNPRRIAMGLRLKRIFDLATSTGQVARFIVFGSFVTTKPEPNDVDIFLMMENEFDVAALDGELKLLFDHRLAQEHFGSSIFWVRRLAALGGEDTMVEDWQLKRDGTRRGIIEIQTDRT